MASGASTAQAASSRERERRGRVLDVLEELLAGGQVREVKTLVAKLVARNEELERLLAQARSPSGRKREGVPGAQLRLLLGGLPANSDGDLAEVDARRSLGVAAVAGEVSCSLAAVLVLPAALVAWGRLRPRSSGHAGA